MTRISAAGSRREQCYGEIVSVDRDNGVTVKLAGSREGEILRLPPFLAGFEAADPGTYRLTQSGEEVVDPDYLSTWIVEEPANRTGH